jgi:hypothetical protein
MLRLWVVSLVLLAAGQARAFCRRTTEMSSAGDTCATEGKPLEWRRSCISVSVLERRSTRIEFDRVRNVVDDSFATWMDVSCGGRQVGLDVRQTIQLAECEVPEYNPRGPNANTIVFVEDWAGDDLPSDAFGLTLVWHSPEDGEIFDADMQINETLGELGICGGVCSAGQVDMQNVITHEAGHFFGLGHSDVRDATMSARASVGEVSKRDLHQDDRDGLCAIYGQNPPAMCEERDHVPDNGFSPACFAGVEESDQNGACSAAQPGRGRSAGAAAMLGWAVVALLVASRRRFAAARGLGARRRRSN